MKVRWSHRIRRPRPRIWQCGIEPGHAVVCITVVFFFLIRSETGGFSLCRCGISTRALLMFNRFSELTLGVVNSTKAALSKNRTILFQINYKMLLFFILYATFQERLSTLPPSALKPGVTFRFSLKWDQRNCSCGKALWHDSPFSPLVPPPPPTGPFPARYPPSSTCRTDTDNRYRPPYQAPCQTPPCKGHLLNTWS